MPTIVHFEIPSDDIERTKKFYTDLFGWKIEKWPGEYKSKVEKLGGKVVSPKKAVPGMGYFALCVDTENNSFAIWESNESAK